MRISCLKPDHGVTGGLEAVVDQLEGIARRDGHLVLRQSGPMRPPRAAVAGLEIPRRIWDAAPEYFGYLAGRVFGLPLAQRKSLALEVGMQNSGLGAALASAHFSPLAAVPSALFSVWHNISGATLSSWFRRLTDKPEQTS